jgi:hypothetical protein
MAFHRTALTPRFAAIRVHLAGLALCLTGLLMLIAVQYGSAVVPVAQHQLKIGARGLVPIYAVVDTESGYLTFANNTDLRITAADSAVDQPELEAASETPGLSSHSVVFHQPDALVARSVPLAQLSLDIELVQLALQQGKDWSRVNSEHVIEVVDLPAGERAVWIQVRHQWRNYDFWNGLLYRVRDHQPKLLLTLTHAQEFSLSDVDGDGFKEVIRILRGQYVSGDQPGYGIAGISWDVHGWNPQTGDFQPLTLPRPALVDSYIASSLAMFLLLSLPFLALAGLSLLTTTRALSTLMGFYFISLNVLILSAATDSAILGVAWVILLLLTQLLALAACGDLNRQAAVLEGGEDNRAASRSPASEGKSGRNSSSNLPSQP